MEQPVFAVGLVSNRSRFWGFLYAQHRHDICKTSFIPLPANILTILLVAVQNYITAIIIFLIVEMLITWGFYGEHADLLLNLKQVLTDIDYMNRHGSNAGSKVMMVVVAVLNAARNSFSFFLLLIVCMGYGVVKPSLGRTMVYIRWLAGGHFIFGLIYSIASLTITPEHAGKLNHSSLQGAILMKQAPLSFWSYYHLLHR